MFFFNVKVWILRGFKLNLKGDLRDGKGVLIFVFCWGYEYSSITKYTDFVVEK